jgi:hypothetical protein
MAKLVQVPNRDPGPGEEAEGFEAGEEGHRQEEGVGR